MWSFQTDISEDELNRISWILEIGNVAEELSLPEVIKMLGWLGDDKFRRVTFD